MGWNYLSIPKLQRCSRWSLGINKWFHHTLYRACDYLSMLGLKETKPQQYKALTVYLIPGISFTSLFILNVTHLINKSVCIWIIVVSMHAYTMNMFIITFKDTSAIWKYITYHSDHTNDVDIIYLTIFGLQNKMMEMYLIIMDTRNHWWPLNAIFQVESKI